MQEIMVYRLLLFSLFYVDDSLLDVYALVS